MNAGESHTSSLEQPTNDQSSNKNHMPDSASQAFVLKQARTGSKGYFRYFIKLSKVYPTLNFFFITNLTQYSFDDFLCVCVCVIK